MKAFLLSQALLAMSLAGCGVAPRLEQTQIDPPSKEELIGDYTIIEETASGLSLAESKLTESRLELAGDGKAHFVDFPIFGKSSGHQGFPHKINEAGNWFITSDQHAYRVILFRANGDGIQATVVEGGNPSDLMIEYSSREEGHFVKLRKLAK